MRCLEAESARLREAGDTTDARIAQLEVYIKEAALRSADTGEETPARLAANAGNNSGVDRAADIAADIAADLAADIAS